MPRMRIQLGWMVVVGATVAALCVGGLPAAGHSPPNALPHAALIGAPALATALPPRLLPPSDPFPLRRVFTPPDRVPDLIARSLRGALIRMPRDEFESKVRAAATAAEIHPRVVEARYRAKYDGRGLNGTAVWRVVRGAEVATGPWLLRLDPLSVSVHNPRWEDNTPAVLYSTAAEGPQVLIDGSGHRTLTLDWSARSVEEPSADRFDLTFPVAPVASLEIDLPVERVPTVSADCLLTGPFPGAEASRRLWRIGLGNGSRVNLSVRNPPGDGQPGPAVRVHRASRFEVSPGIAACSYEFDLEAVRELPSALTLEADQGLRITSITGRERLDWQFEPLRRADAPTRVRVSNIRAGNGRVVVSGFVAVPADPSGWPCPQVRVLDGLPGADTIDVRVGTEVRFLGCDPADYRVTAASADRGYRLAFAAAPMTAGRTERRPPILRLRHAGAEYTSNEDVTWHVTSRSTLLTARFRLRVTRGPVVQIPVEVSAGYRAETVTLTPDDPGVVWSRRSGGLVLEPTRPISAGQTLDVRVEFRGPPPRVGMNLLTVAPIATLSEAIDRAGSFTVSVDPHLRAWASPPPPDGGTSQLFAYPFRGRSPDLGLSLMPRRSVALASREVRVSRAGNDILTETTMRVRPEIGPVPTLLVFTPHQLGDEWSVRTDVGNVRPAPVGELLGWTGLLAAGGAWQAVASTCLTAEILGSVWRVENTAPTGAVTVLATARRHEPPVGTLPVLPIPTVLGADNTLTTVLVSPTLVGQFASPPRPRTEFPATVRLSAPATATVQNVAAWQFADLRLIHQISTDGRVRCRFSGRVTMGPGIALPVGLPSGATVESVVVNGHHVASMEIAPPADREHPELSTWVRLPLPSSTDGTLFELVYRPLDTYSDTGIPRICMHHTIAAPLLPGPPTEVSATWELAPEYLVWNATESSDPGGTRATITIVSVAAVVAAGYAFAATTIGAIVVLAGRGRRSRGWALAYAALMVVGGTSASHLTTWWEPFARPMIITGMLAVMWLALKASSPPTTGFGSVARLASRTGLVVCGILVTAPLCAQSSEPATVYLIAGAAPRAMSVFVPPVVLKRLDDLVHPPVPNAIITAAEYEGALTSGSAPVFTGRFRLFCPRAGENLVPLPLTGVRLEGMTLDGKHAYPDGSQPDRYTVTVRGSGTHDLTVRFAVVPTAAGAEHEVRFGVPDVPACRVRFTGPPGASRLDIPSRRGSQSVTPAGAPSVEADHGGGKVVTVRWWAAAQGGSRPVVTVKEACVWDMSAAGDLATAAFLFRIEGGSATRLAIEIPDGLEPDIPTVRGIAPQAGTITPDGPGLRDWQVSGPTQGWRTVDLQFQSPAEGRFAVILRLLPRLPGSLRPVLRFPRAVGVSQSDSYYAVRAADVSVASPTRTGVIDYAPEAMTREFATIPELQLDRRPVDQAYQRNGETPEVRPTVSPLVESGSGTTEVTWTIGRHAEALGIVRVARPNTSFVELELPDAVQVREVRAADMESWGRSGTRVYVWLRKPVNTVEVRWVGELTGYPPHDPKSPDPRIAITLPAVRLIDVAPTMATLRVRPASGWSVVPAQEPAPPADPDGGRTYHLPPQAAFPRVRIFAPQSPSAGHLWEEITRVGSGVRYQARLLITLAPQRPHRFVLRLTSLAEGSVASVRGPEDCRLRPMGNATWDVSVPASNRSLALEVSAEVPVPGPLPETVLIVDGPPILWSTHVMSVTDPGLVPVPLPRGWHIPTSAERDDLRSTWPGISHDRTTPNPWIADSTARPWVIPTIMGSPKASLHVPQSRAEVAGSETIAVTPTPGVQHQRTIEDYARTSIWVVGIVAMLAFIVWGPPSWWTERLIGCGVLGAVAVGAGTGIGLLFWGTAVAGVAVRLAKWVAHAARTVTA